MIKQQTSEEIEKDYVELFVNYNNFLSDKWKTPFLFETWNWEGDETVLPYKLLYLTKLSPISSLYSEAKLKEILRNNYYNNSKFDKKSFFFITHRSDTAGCVYLNYKQEENIFVIDFLIVNGKKYSNRGVEQALINLAINKALEKKDRPIIKFNKSTTNIKLDEILNSMGLLFK